MLFDQGSANLEFWETYKLPEIYQQLVAADNVLATILSKDIDVAAHTPHTQIIDNNLFIVFFFIISNIHSALSPD